MSITTGVKPILGPRVNWAELLKDVVSLTGHSLTQGIDSYTYNLTECAQYIAAIGEFRSNKELNPVEVIRTANDLLDCLWFGFLIYGKVSLIWAIMEQTDLKIISTRIQGGRVAIVTGTLKDWKNATITCLIKTASSELRWTFNQCLDFFYSLGLRDVWFDYAKQGLKDKTYLLEAK